MTRRDTDKHSPFPIDQRCNHPLPAVLFEPTDEQLSDLEAMLARCPVCSRWSPGDGPIMAIIPRLVIPRGGPEEQF